MRNIALIGLAASALATPLPRAITGMGLQLKAKTAEEMLEEIQAATAEMRTTFEQQIAARVPDTLFNEKIGNLQTTLDGLTEGLEAIQARVDAANLGAPIVGDLKGHGAEYVNSFKGFMRNGEVNAAMSIGTDADGGYLAPIEWDRTLTPALQTENPLRRYAQVITLGSGQGFSRLYSSGAPGSGWVGETAARPATTTPTLATLDFNFGEIYANPAITQRALDDVALNLEEWLNGEVAAEFGRQEGIAFLSGNGTNKPFGVLTYVAGAANAARHPFGAIEAVTSGAAALDADDFISLIYELEEERVGADSALYVNRRTVRDLRLLKDSNGQYLWQPPVQAGEPASFLGEPIRTLPGMPVAADGAGAVVALYGDMRRTYLIVDRVGIRVLRDPYTNKPFVHFYTTRRVGGGVQNPEYMKALVRAA